MTAKFEKTRHYPFDKETLLKKSKLAIENCRFKFVMEDKDNGRILAKAGFSAFSWGEEILISIEEDGNVTMESACVFPLQIISWGKNKNNVNRFFKKMSEN